MDSIQTGFLKKALSQDNDVVIIAVDARAPMQELMERLSVYPPGMIHLGQGALGALLLQAMSDTDEEEKVEMQWATPGPFGNLYADALGTGKFRATLQNLQADVQDLTTTLGAGQLQVRRSKGERPASTGIVAARGQVAEDLVEYLNSSEQRRSGINLSIHIGWDDEAEKEGRWPFRIEKAAGYLVHVLPQEVEAKKESLAEAWDQRMKMMGPLAEWALPETSNDSCQHIIDMLSVGSKSKVILEHDVKLSCTCSVDRAERALALLTDRERKHLIDELQDEGKKFVEMTCEYCGSSYRLALDAG